MLTDTDSSATWFVPPTSSPFARGEDEGNWMCLNQIVKKLFPWHQVSSSCQSLNCVSVLQQNSIICAQIHHFCSIFSFVGEKKLKPLGVNQFTRILFLFVSVNVAVDLTTDILHAKFRLTIWRQASGLCWDGQMCGMDI